MYFGEMTPMSKSWRVLYLEGLPQRCVEAFLEHVRILTICLQMADFG